MGSEELLQDQYVRHLEKQTRTQQERIEALEQQVQKLETQLYSQTHCEDEKENTL